MILLPVTMTFRDYDRVRALADGRVGIEVLFAPSTMKQSKS